MRKHRFYPFTVRRSAIQALIDNPDKTIAEVAADLGIPSGTIFNWKSRFDMAGDEGLQPQRSREVRTR
jgi:transposase-like protein